MIKITSTMIDDNGSTSTSISRGSPTHTKKKSLIKFIGPARNSNFL